MGARTSTWRGRESTDPARGKRADSSVQVRRRKNSALRDCRGFSRGGKGSTYSRWLGSRCHASGFGTLIVERNLGSKLREDLCSSNLPALSLVLTYEGFTS